MKEILVLFLAMSLVVAVTSAPADYARCNVACAVLGQENVECLNACSKRDNTYEPLKNFDTSQFCPNICRVMRQQDNPDCLTDCQQKISA